MEGIVMVEFLEIYLGTKKGDSWLVDNQISSKVSQSTKDEWTMTLKIQDKYTREGIQKFLTY